MESLDEGSKNTKGFFKHVFNFDNESKSDILNIIQYSLIAITPTVLLNKAMQKFVPEADEEKGSLEILAEIVIQIICMFIGILIVHRFITYIPTYSEKEYPDVSVIFNILAVLMITLSLQTKLGEKVSIIVDRIVDLWEGKDKNKKKKKSGNVKVSQPISQNQMITSGSSSSSYSDGTSIHQLPTNANNDSSYSMNPQQPPNYNNMYMNDPTPLVNAASPGPESFQNGGGVMAANEVLGGSAFSSW